MGSCLDAFKPNWRWNLHVYKRHAGSNATNRHKKSFLCLKHRNTNFLNQKVLKLLEAWWPFSWIIFVTKSKLLCKCAAKLLSPRFTGSHCVQQFRPNQRAVLLSTLNCNVLLSLHKASLHWYLSLLCWSTSPVTHRTGHTICVVRARNPRQRRAMRCQHAWHSWCQRVRLLLPIQLRLALLHQVLLFSKK